MQLLFWLAAGLWLLLALKSLRAVIGLRLLPRADNQAGPLPSVTVIVAARDEAARIETTVRRLLAQRGVGLRLVVVDDRSADETGPILRRLAAEDPRLEVVRVDDLPAGWLGKCHALHLGAARAAGDWLLFTDGDIWLGPDVIARAVRRAEADGADHLTLMPGVRGATFPGAVCQLVFGLGIAARADRVNRDAAGAYLGVGAFNLTRAETYRAFGGHEPLRLEVVDDIKLGLLVRRAGGRSRVFFAPRDADADWCPGAWAMVKGLEKNHFAHTGYSLARVAAGVGLMVGFWLLGLIGPWTGTTAGVAAGLGLLSLAVPAAVAAVRLRMPLLAAPLVPLFLPVLAVSLANSAAVTVWRGGVRWRDTFYPLAALRAGLVR
ncbi:MAG: glycosyltransferase [Gemmataceae bacterium]|nr:glycosyltransferase [Gemmataceae bacterium]